MKTDRRAFLIGSAALAMMPDRLWAAEQGLPEYYADYLADLRKRIERSGRTAADAFWFVTDLHVPSNRRQSGPLLAHLVRTMPVTRVVSGGDLCEAFGEQASVDGTIGRWRNEWVRPIEAAGGEVYAAKGNHDFTIRKSPTADEGFTYPAARAREILTDTRAMRKAVYDSEDPAACYCYVDNVRAKIRYVIADTTDAIDPSRSYWAVKSSLGDRQLQWHAEHSFAGLADGWSVVVIHHIPIATVVGTGGEARHYADFRRLLEAYQNRETVTLRGKKHDYSAARGRILLDLTGHHHTERATYQRGVLHVTNPCDAAYADYRFGGLATGEVPEKTRGTVYEQTFDCVHLDPSRNEVRFTRVGGGTDRIYHLDPLVLKAGVQIVLPGVGASGAIDGDWAEQSRHPTRKYTTLYKFRSTYVTADEAGRLTAVKAGESIAWRCPPEGPREFWPVIVRG